MVEMPNDTFAMTKWTVRFDKLLANSLKLQNVVAVLIMLIFVGINFSSVFPGYSLTKDEDKHYLYGENILSGDSTRFDDSKMPFTALNALPKKVTQAIGNELIIRLGGRFYTARTVTILFSSFIAFLVFYWSRELYGFLPAIFSLLLYVLDPNISAHSQLVTTDIYAVGTILFAFFWLWKFANQRSLSNGLWCSFALGISQIAKYTAVVLFPLFFLSLCVYDLMLWYRGTDKVETFKTFGLRYLKYAILAIVIVLFVINVGFLFNRTFTPFGEYTFYSDFFRNIQNEFPLLDHFPVPVPYPYLNGLDLISFNERNSSSYGNIYLLGQVSAVKGFPGYFIVASLLKVPIATQIILIIAFVTYFSQRNRRSNFLRNEFFLLTPIVFFTIYFNFFFNAQIGIRYYLPVFPFLYIFSGNLFSGWKKFSIFQKAVSWGLIGYLCASVFSYYPYYLSYFNEIVWNRTQAYKYLADSNVDWGQSRNELREYLLQDSTIVYRPQRVQSGHLVVSVNDLVGVTSDPAQYAWLRTNFEPNATIAYSYLVYKISPEEIEMLCSTTVYCDK